MLSKYLVKKYLRFDKSQPFITISAFLAFFGVAIGLMVLMVAMAIMNGFDKEFERKLFTMNYPLTIHPNSFKMVSSDDVDLLNKKFPHLKFSPYISSQVITKRGNKLEGGMLFGVDFEKEKEINSVLNKGIGDNKLGKFDIVVGSEIRKKYYLEEDEKLTLIFTQSDPGGLSLIPKMKRFTYKADFESGLIAYDKLYMYTQLEGLSKILRYKKNTYDGIHVYSETPFEDIKSIKKVLPDYLSVVGWWQMNGNFFSALALEKRALFIVLMLIILIASLNIISSLLMTVMNRRKEIALLLSLGAYKEEVKKAFFYLGLIIGGGGMVFGILLGFLSLFLLGSFDLIDLPADVYGSSKLPLELSLIDFSMIVVGAAIIVTLSSFYPAHKATQIDVLDTLRNE
ncbi:ABC transporter permease [Sulfurospirillum arcachonense]|uniref:ABC transporter permease n=1 Tax=Sulfurospirillum arcachonense TaxID=57666 RepID=UPI0004B22476|nr:ABC transporter permease [Sulfurospirillum arcachonense]